MSRGFVPGFVLLRIFHKSLLILVLAMMLTSNHGQGQDIRLVDGNSPNVGRVEFFVFGYWTEICQPLDSYEADIACRQIGYTEAVESFVQESNNTEANMIVDRVGGCENVYTQKLEACISSYNRDFRPKFLLSCANIISGMDNPRAWLHCKVDVRLTDGECSSQGRVEIYHKGDFRTVCGDYGWNISDANIVCRHLGYQRAIKTLNFALDTSKRRLHFSSFNCGQQAQSMSECKNLNTYLVQYDYLEECSADAGLECGDHITCYWYNFILYVSIGSAVTLSLLIFCMLAGIKQRQNQKRHRRRVIYGNLTRAEILHQNELGENNRSVGEVRAPLMTSSSVSSRTDEFHIPNEERSTPSNHNPSDHRHFPSEEQPNSPLSVEQPHSPISREQPHSPVLEDQPNYPVPSAPPESMDVGDPAQPTPFNIAPSIVDLPPSASPSAPPEYDVFHELDRDDFVPQDNHSIPRSNSGDAVIDPSLLDTPELFEANLSPSSNIPISTSLPSSAPPTRDPPPEYDEFIENQNQYGFVSETEQPDTPPPEYQPPPSDHANRMNASNSETTTEV